MVNITFLSNGGKVVTAPENSNLLRVSLKERGGIPFKCCLLYTSPSPRD